MKRIVKLCCLVLVLGIVLALGGWIAGGQPYTSFWGGRPRTLRESLSMGSTAIRPNTAGRVDPDNASSGSTFTVTGLDFELDRGDYRILAGSEAAYSITGDGAKNLESWFDEDKIWHIECTPGYGKNPAVTIYLPADAYFDEIEIEAAAGSLELDALRARQIELNVGAAACDIDRIECDALSVDVGAGALETGRIDAKLLSADVGMGAFTGTLAGSAEDYRYEAEAALGAVTLDGATVAGGIAAEGAGGSGSRLLDLNVGMGSIELGCES